MQGTAMLSLVKSPLLEWRSLAYQLLLLSAGSGFEPEIVRCSIQLSYRTWFGPGRN